MRNNYPQLLLRFSQKRFIEDSLIKGRFKINLLSSYRKLENEQFKNFTTFKKINIEPPESLRFIQDPNDGLLNFSKGKLLSLKYNGQELLPEKTNELNAINKNFNEDCRVLCFYNALDAYEGDIVEGKIETHHLEVNPDMLNFENSDYCIAIYNVPEFFRRLYKIDRNIVNRNIIYIDNFEEGTNYDCFIKHKNYSFQNEHRIKFNINEDFIEIGSIEDIAYMLHKKDLNKLRLTFIK